MTVSIHLPQEEGGPSGVETVRQQTLEGLLERAIAVLLPLRGLPKTALFLREMRPATPPSSPSTRPGERPPGDALFPDAARLADAASASSTPPFASSDVAAAAAAAAAPRDVPQ